MIRQPPQRVGNYGISAIFAILYFLMPRVWGHAHYMNPYPYLCFTPLDIFPQKSPLVCEHTRESHAENVVLFKCELKMSSGGRPQQDKNTTMCTCPCQGLTFSHTPYGSYPAEEKLPTRVIVPITTPPTTWSTLPSRRHRRKDSHPSRQPIHNVHPNEQSIYCTFLDVFQVKYAMEDLPTIDDVPMRFRGNANHSLTVMIEPHVCRVTLTENCCPNLSVSSQRLPEHPPPGHTPRHEKGRQPCGRQHLFIFQLLVIILYILYHCDEVHNYHEQHILPVLIMIACAGVPSIWPFFKNVLITHYSTDISMAFCNHSSPYPYFVYNNRKSIEIGDLLEYEQVASISSPSTRFRVICITFGMNNPIHCAVYPSITYAMSHNVTHTFFLQLSSPSRGNGHASATGNPTSWPPQNSSDVNITVPDPMVSPMHPAAPKVGFAYCLAIVHLPNISLVKTYLVQQITTSTIYYNLKCIKIYGRMNSAITINLDIPVRVYLGTYVCKYWICLFDIHAPNVNRDYIVLYCLKLYTGRGSRYMSLCGTPECKYPYHILCTYVLTKLPCMGLVDCGLAYNFGLCQCYLYIVLTCLVIASNFLPSHLHTYDEYEDSCDIPLSTSHYPPTALETCNSCPSNRNTNAPTTALQLTNADRLTSITSRRMNVSYAAQSLYESQYCELKCVLPEVKLSRNSCSTSSQGQNVSFSLKMSLQNLVIVTAGRMHLRGRWDTIPEIIYVQGNSFGKNFRSWEKV